MSKDDVPSTRKGTVIIMKRISNFKVRKVYALAAAIILAVSLSITASAQKKLSELSPGDEVYAGGMPFGIKLYTDGILIVGFSPVDCGDSGSQTPATDAGLTVGDVIKEANGAKITSAAQFAEAVNSCGGNLLIKYVRGGKEYEANVKPSLSKKDGKMKTGMWLRDSTAGIGTVTFTVPETGEFAGLGHGVCDTESGELIPLSSGSSADVRISGIKKGSSGCPGELRGYFTATDTGTITGNTKHGVFGIFKECKTNPMLPDTVEIGSKSDIRTGEADIYCTLDGCEPSLYKICIVSLPKDGSNFEIEVRDASLLEKTGGIVQGMSGSPIIQDGKLVGAVTHVLVNDPTRGYGIFIENMLDAAG